MPNSDEPKYGWVGSINATADIAEKHAGQRKLFQYATGNEPMDSVGEVAEKLVQLYKEAANTDDPPPPIDSENLGVCIMIMRSKI